MFFVSIIVLVIVFVTTHLSLTAEKLGIYVRFVIKIPEMKRIQNITNKQVNANISLFRNICICATHNLNRCERYIFSENDNRKSRKKRFFHFFCNPEKIFTYKGTLCETKTE